MTWVFLFGFCLLVLVLRGVWVRVRAQQAKDLEERFPLDPRTREFTYNRLFDEQFPAPGAHFDFRVGGGEISILWENAPEGAVRDEVLAEIREQFGEGLLRVVTDNDHAINWTIVTPLGD